MLILYNQKMNNDIEISTVHYKHNLKKHNTIFGLIDKIAENIKKSQIMKIFVLKLN